MLEWILDYKCVGESAGTGRKKKKKKTFSLFDILLECVAQCSMDRQHLWTCCEMLIRINHILFRVYMRLTEKTHSNTADILMSEIIYIRFILYKTHSLQLFCAFYCLYLLFIITSSIIL